LLVWRPDILQNVSLSAADELQHAIRRFCIANGRRLNEYTTLPGFEVHDVQAIGSSINGVVARRKLDIAGLERKRDMNANGQFGGLRLCGEAAEKYKSERYHDGESKRFHNASLYEVFALAGGRRLALICHVGLYASEFRLVPTFFE
jgi:hypothetical protein